MPRIVTFGEIMGRLASPGHLRLRQALPGLLEATFGGSEANVAASLAMLGAEATFVTALPRHAIADACVDRLRGLGVDTRFIIRTDKGRLGLYFLEVGANQRPSHVIYDREGSAVAITLAESYPWDAVLTGARWFHFSGITPALSRVAMEAVATALQHAKQAGATVSCDLNFRNKLWRWDPTLQPRQLAEQVMRNLLPKVDVLIANEEDCHDVLGIQAGQTEVATGRLDVDRYPDVARQAVRQFPNLSLVAITLRQSLSASHNNWGSILYHVEEDHIYLAPTADGGYQPYEIHNIVDRVGVGDSFAAGLIFALTTPELTLPATAICFATAASCLAHTVAGDFNYSTRNEIGALMGGSATGRVIR